MDLLTAREEPIDLRTRELRFDIGLLADRVACSVDWLRDDDRTHALPIGLFGASTGAAAAPVAAAKRPETVAAVVSRGGRPDLADEHLARVEAPTRLRCVTCCLSAASGGTAGTWAIGPTAGSDL